MHGFSRVTRLLSPFLEPLASFIYNTEKVVIRGPTSQGCDKDRWVDAYEIQFWAHCTAWQTWVE